VVTRRGRGKTVCAYRALLGGPSTSPLDAVNRAAALVSLLLLSACARAIPPPELLGHWTLSEPVQNCASASMEFTEDGHLRMTSGEQTLDTVMVLTPKDDGFLIALRLIGHNTKPNCQGVSADFVAAHFIPFIFVRVSGHVLTSSMLDRSLTELGPPLKFNHGGV
jgi:hypothetical protein